MARVESAPEQRDSVQRPSWPRCRDRGMGRKYVSCSAHTDIPSTRRHHACSTIERKTRIDGDRRRHRGRMTNAARKQQGGLRRAAVVVRRRLARTVQQALWQKCVMRWRGSDSNKVLSKFILIYSTVRRLRSISLELIKVTSEPWSAWAGRGTTEADRETREKPERKTPESRENPERRIAACSF